MLSQNGFLLSYIKYGDYDAVLHSYTKEKGYQSFFARGIYAKKNKKKAYLQPLSELSFTLSPSSKSGSMPTVSKIEPSGNPEFFQSVKTNSIIFFVSDFLNQVLRHEAENLLLYREILNFLDELKTENHRSHFIFLIKFLENLGISPLIKDFPYLNPEKGIFTTEQHHHLFDEPISLLWKKIILQENPYKTDIPSKIREHFLDGILVYYHYHFTDFKTPNSLEIVQQIFKNNL